MRFEVWQMKDYEGVQLVASCQTPETAQEICDVCAHCYPSQDYAVKEVKVA